MALFRRGARPEPSAAAVGPATSVTDDRCHPAVGANWLQAPTLAETGTQMPLKGTSCYQPVIAPLAWSGWDASPATDLLTVQLAVVLSGQWAGAVGVYAAGVRVASISADQAEQYAAVVNELADAGLPATARAVVVGGHRRGTRGSDALRFGLALIAPTRPARAGATPPFLPPEIGYQVDVPDTLAHELDAALPSRARNYIRRTTGRIDVGNSSLIVDGRRVGRIRADRPEQLDLVRAAAAAGHPTTYLVRMIRAPGRKLRVMADLPMVSSGPATGLTFDLI